jgi:imidazolonepropionase-like amidohydrolase
MFKIIPFLILILLQTVSAKSVPLVLRVNKYLDVITGEYIENKDIFIEDGIITKIIPQRILMTKKHTLIELNDLVLLPGLIDMHSHLFFFDDTYGEDLKKALHKNISLDKKTRYSKFKKRAKSYLRNGFTSVRDLGNSGKFLDISERDKKSSSSSFSPRILGSGPGLCHGTCQFSSNTPSSKVRKEYLILKPKDKISSILKNYKKKKIDVLKIYADSEPGLSSFSLGQLTEIIKWSKENNILTTTHSVFLDSSKNAIQAGTDSIEHGYNLDLETLKKMSKENIYLIPTDNHLETLTFLNSKWRHHEADTELMQRYLKRKKRLLEAYQEKVPIAGGTDLYADFEKIGKSLGPFALMTLIHFSEAGIPNKDVIRMFTYNSSLLLKNKKLGQIKVGAYADFVGIEGDVLKDINNIKNIHFVMKHGQVFVGK